MIMNEILAMIFIGMFFLVPIWQCILISVIAEGKKGITAIITASIPLTWYLALFNMGNHWIIWGFLFWVCMILCAYRAKKRRSTQMAMILPFAVVSIFNISITIKNLVNEAIAWTYYQNNRLLEGGLTIRFINRGIDEVLKQNSVLIIMAFMPCVGLVINTYRAAKTK